MTIAWPDEEGFDPVDFEFGIDAPYFAARSLFTNSMETNRSPFSIWIATLVLPAVGPDLHAEREGFLAGVLANDERVLIPNFVRPTPRGTISGLPTLAANAAQFANVLSITTPADTTVLRGDLLSVGNQLFMATETAVSVAGTMSLPVAGRVRSLLTSGSAVVWDRPTARYLMSARSAALAFTRSAGDKLTLTFEEDWL